MKEKQRRRTGRHGEEFKWSKVETALVTFGLFAKSTSGMNE